MPKSRKPKSARLIAAEILHKKFMQKMGIDTSRKPRLTGAVANPLTAMSPDRAGVPCQTSDLIGNGPARSKPQIELPEGTTITQLYNKGGLGIVPKSEVGNAKRRDR